MRIQSLNSKFIMPTKGSSQAGAWDIYMPTEGAVRGETQFVPLGFASAIPTGYVALLLPRSGAGAKYGLELNNTCGVIDADYRGEWKAAMKTKNGLRFGWETGERVLQFVVVPVYMAELELVSNLDETERGAGGFGHTGN